LPPAKRWFLPAAHRGAILADITLIAAGKKVVFAGCAQGSDFVGHQLRCRRRKALQTQRGLRPFRRLR
jgi:hypothetical protein